MAETFVLLHGSWHGGWAWEPTAWSSRLGPCKIVPMAGSHEVMFTRPAELARTLTEAAHD